MCRFVPYIVTVDTPRQAIEQKLANETGHTRPYEQVKSSCIEWELHEEMEHLHDTMLMIL